MNIRPVSELIEVLRQKGFLAETKGSPENLVPTSFTTNSKMAEPGTFFVCKGLTFKKEYLDMAKEKGAILYLADHDYGVDLPCIIVNELRPAVSEAARWFYDYPSAQMVLAGMTGTKGKTTTAYILKAILDAEEQYRTALFSTCEIITGKKSMVSHLTTPEPAELQSYFREALDNGCRRVVMEVSSQAMKMNRVYGENYFVGMFLNIGDDHVGANEHASKEEYVACKVAFLSQCQNCIINKETDYLEQAIAGCPEGSRVILYGHDDSCDAQITNIDADASGSRFDLTFDGRTEHYETSLVGRFNVENMTAAIVAAKLMQIPEEAIRAGIRDIYIPGRMMILDAGDFHVVIDYAHNYLSCDNLYRAVIEAFHPNHIISMFGAAGERDFSRKQSQGELAEKYADYVILTEDDPGFEGAEKIANEIRPFIKTKPVEMIFGREKAVYAALEKAQPGDVVVMAGKGADTTMRVRGEHVPYISDVKATEKWIAEHKLTKNTH